jgi:hypothetical protein
MQDFILCELRSDRDTCKICPTAASRYTASDGQPARRNFLLTGSSSGLIGASSLNDASL